MPRRTNPWEDQIQNLKVTLTPALTLLDELDESLAPPFIAAIGKITRALVDGLEAVKRNKDECFQLVGSIHGILYAIINAHLKSDTMGSLPPATLEQLGEFTKTLHKIFRFLEAQLEGNRIKRFLRQNETNGMLKECRAGLDQAMEVFKLQSGYTVSDMSEAKKMSELMHEELLELISILSDGINSDGSSLVWIF
ncbi:hypothetical protein B0H16DRAFT_1729700 [Mycena metata]|uniref:Uncharacterized protein n=1 Tax=Mycena metata TaxID=1033252 RepID=A0AAD7IAG8_9AGAR|nr:hypothetical protein B0H16DRAFT_1729700 [Mycena metata]